MPLSIPPSPSMETTLVLQHKSSFPTVFRWKYMPKLNQFPSVLPLSTGPVKIEEISTTSSKTVYNDNWFDRIAINYLSQNVQTTTGLRNNKNGYESLVEVATVVSRTCSPCQQQRLVIESLQKAFPKPILSLIRMLLPQSTFAREYFAAFTTFFFAWLVGPCEVKESEFHGRREKNVVHIKKCRFVEETNCVGMCTNLCKLPSQTFIKDSLGTPVNMVPNFHDMSCEMVFGQDPPLPIDDSAFQQPCYKLCKAKKNHKQNCTS